MFIGLKGGRTLGRFLIFDGLLVDNEPWKLNFDALLDIGQLIGLWFLSIGLFDCFLTALD